MPNGFHSEHTSHYALRANQGIPIQEPIFELIDDGICIVGHPSVVRLAGIGRPDEHSGASAREASDRGLVGRTHAHRSIVDVNFKAGSWLPCVLNEIPLAHFETWYYHLPPLASNIDHHKEFITTGCVNLCRGREESSYNSLEATSFTPQRI